MTKIFHGGVRGAVVAMAMTEMRAFTVVSGLVGRAAPAADHALYGFGLSETRKRPQR